METDASLMPTASRPAKSPKLVANYFTSYFSLYPLYDGSETPAHAGRWGQPAPAIESSRLLLAWHLPQLGHSIPSISWGVVSSQRIFCPWWRWPLTFDLDVQTHPTEGPNTSSRVNLAQIRSAVPVIHCWMRVPRIEDLSMISPIWRISGRQTIAVNSS